MMCLYVETTSAITYSSSDQEIYIGAGETIRIEVLTLQFFKLILPNAESLILERTELDFLLRHACFQLQTQRKRSRRLKWTSRFDSDRDRNGGVFR